MVAAVCLILGQVEGAELVSGPMVGHTTTSTADIWVETDKSTDFAVKYWTLDGGEKHVLVRREEKDGEGVSAHRDGDLARVGAEDARSL